VIGYDLEPSRAAAAVARPVDDIASLAADVELILMSLPGTLTIVAGGSVEALERVRWALEPFSAKIVHVGEAGAGHAV